MTPDHRADPSGINLLRGERILWRGSQWYVSTHGLGCIRNSTYWYEKHRIGWKPGDGVNFANHTVPYTDPLTGIVRHNASDPYFDLEDLIEANWQAIRRLRRPYPKSEFEKEADYVRRYRAFALARKALRRELIASGELAYTDTHNLLGWQEEDAVLEAELARRGYPQSPDRTDRGRGG
jgi:hypothetical protein